MSKPLTLRQKQSIFLKNAAKLILFAFDQGYELTGGELLRTPEQQAIYKQKGLTKTDFSQHMQKLAIDLFLFIDGTYITNTAKYKELGDYWVSLHPLNRWGGDWNKNGQYTDEKFLDGNHFEMQ